MKLGGWEVGRQRAQEVKAWKLGSYEAWRREAQGARYRAQGQGKRIKDNFLPKNTKKSKSRIK
jgi:hypothetical protein